MSLPDLRSLYKPGSTGIAGEPAFRFSRTLRAVCPLYLDDGSETQWIHVHGGLFRVVFPAIHRTRRARD